MKMRGVFLVVGFIIIISTLTEARGALLDIGHLKEMVKKYVNVRDDAKSSNLHSFKREQQDLIDLGELKARELKPCPSCGHPALPTDLCEFGYKPIINASKDGSCGCVQSYECCPEKCGAAKDEDKCYAEGEGKRYPIRSRNCCGCEEILCPLCPSTKGFNCSNPCDEPHFRPDPTTKCPVGICRRVPKPNYTEPNCSKCKHAVQTSDKCGFHKKVCMCKEIPDCEPPRPPEVECHSIAKVFLDAWHCALDGDTCEQCFGWKYTLNPVHNVDAECLPCQTKKILTGVCGNYTQTCECRTPQNCQPPTPEAPKCHRAVKRLSKDTFQCSAEGQSCVACYHWEFELEKLVAQNEVLCDDRCYYKMPEQQDCGIEYSCICTGKKKDFCQPSQPVEQECYKPVKQIIEGSFMCAHLNETDKCGQCWNWQWEKKACPLKETVPCKAMCERSVRRHLGCGCYTDVCVPTKIPDCQPDKKAEDKCYTNWEKKYRNLYTRDDVSRECRQCFNWTRKHRDFPENNLCAFHHLPQECMSEWREKGDCGQIITNCRKNAERCVETFDNCPAGMELVSMTSSCGNGRDACVDCVREFSSKELQKEWPDQCYENKIVKFLSKCDFNVHVKKDCPVTKLATGSCKIPGQKRRLFFDECNCPHLKCSGCDRTKKLDIQILIDSSQSVKENHWNDLRDTLKVYFVDSIMTGESAMAFAKFGKDYKILQTLSFDLKGEDLDSAKYEYENMRFTFTGEALEGVFHSFDKLARWNQTDVHQILVVITDGRTNGNVDVGEAAKLWKEAGVEVYALGYAGPDEEGLKLITDNYKMLSDINELNKEIKQNLVPEICGYPNDG